MLGSKYSGISPGTLTSFFTKNKHLKIQKQDLHLLNYFFSNFIHFLFNYLIKHGEI